MKRHQTILCAALTFTALAGTPGAALAVDKWVNDERSGCKLVDVHPVAHRSVLWDGACPNGAAEGTGTVQWFSDSKAESTQTGTFIAGRAEGPGEIKWATGRHYRGDWVAGHRTGKGVLVFSNGDRFIGRFNNDRPAGDGEYVTINGLRLVAHVTEDGAIRAGEPITAQTPAPTEPPPAAPSPSEALAPPPPPPPTAADRAALHRPIGPPLALTAPEPPLTAALPSRAETPVPAPPPIPAPIKPEPLGAPEPGSVMTPPPARTAGAPLQLSPLPTLGAPEQPPISIIAPLPLGEAPATCRAPNGAVVPIDPASCLAIGGMPLP